MSWTGPWRQLCDSEVWLIYVLIGDGIATNEAAAKLVLRLAQRDPPGGGAFQFFLVLIKCASHQASLVNSTASIGTAAKVAAAGAPAAEPPRKKLAGTCVRLFKYLTADYYEEFVHSCDLWLRRNLRVLSSDQARPGERAKAELLAKLYGNHVLPEDLMDILNNGLCLEHVVPAGVDPDSVREDVLAKLLRIITKHLLTVDSHPTLTRMWTFGESVDRFLMYDTAT